MVRDSEPSFALTNASVRTVRAFDEAPSGNYRNLEMGSFCGLFRNTSTASRWHRTVLVPSGRIIWEEAFA